MFPSPDPSRPALRFSVRGLRIRVDPTFLAIAVLIGFGVRGTAGFLAGAVVVFLVVLAHELGHAFAAQVFGLRPAIDLFWLGGVTTAEGTDRLSRTRRLSVVIAGPAAGAAIGLLAWWLTLERHGAAGDAGSVALWIGVIWGLANLVPIVPLDGGLVLLDVLSGSLETRLRRARMVSVAVAGVGVIAAFAVRAPVLALFPAWLGYVNLAALRAEGAAVPRWRALYETLGVVDATTAADAEQQARATLAAARDVHVRSAAADLLLVSHLVRAQYAEARAALAEFADVPVNPAFRDLAVLGALAGRELDDRLAGAPTDHDVRTAAMNQALQSDWPQLVALVESELASRLDLATLTFCQTRAFHRSAFAESAQLGEMAEQRSDVAAAVPYNVACAFARLGQPGHAIAALERAAESGWTDVQQLDRDDDLASLRALDDYARVRRRMRGGRKAPMATDEPDAKRTGAAIGLVGCAAVIAGLVLVLPDTSSRAFPGRDWASEVVAFDLRSGQLLWQHDLAGYTTSLTSTEHGVAITGIDADGSGVGSVVTLLDMADGREVFVVEGAEFSLAGARDGLVLVHDYTDVSTVLLRGFDLSTQAQRWSLDAGFGEVEFFRDTAVVADYELSGLTGVDVQSGQKLWERRDLVRVFADTAPDVVLASSENGLRLLGLEPRTGAERWSVDVDGRYHVLQRAIWVDDGAHERSLIDLATGTQRTIEVTDAATQPLLELEDVVIARVTGGVAALDATTGALRWTQPSARLARVIAADGVLVAESVDGIALHDRSTGARRWESRRSATVVATTSDVVVLEDDGRLLALAISDGHEVWSVDTGLPVAEVAVAGDRLVVGRI